MDILSTNPRVAISPLDLDISQHCERLLMAEPSVEELRGSVGAFYAMKAVLSYHHALKQTDVGLPDMVYLLTLPFISTVSSKLSRREPAGNSIVALLVEEFFSFLQSRPAYMVDSGSEVCIQHCTVQ